MFKLFGVNKDKPFAIIHDMTVNFMFDPPHLLKCLRNNLMKHDFDVNGHLVKWKYIADFYKRDSQQTLKLAPKLTDRHLNLPPFAAMRVRLASQVFSHSVAAGIHTHVAFGALPEDAVQTAEFIDNIDGLFDCLNAGSLKSPKIYSCALTATSAHWKHLQTCRNIFSRLQVVSNKAMQVPCISGFLLTINSVIRLFNELTIILNFCSQIA